AGAVLDHERGHRRPSGELRAGQGRAARQHRVETTGRKRAAVGRRRGRLFYLPAAAEGDDGDHGGGRDRQPDDRQRAQPPTIACDPSWQTVISSPLRPPLPTTSLPAHRCTPSSSCFETPSRTLALSRGGTRQAAARARRRASRTTAATASASAAITPAPHASATAPTP